MGGSREPKKDHKICYKNYLCEHCGSYRGGANPKIQRAYQYQMIKPHDVTVYSFMFLDNIGNNDKSELYVVFSLTTPTTEGINKLIAVSEESGGRVSD